MPRRSGDGFSLIEFLVVISIITVLAAMLFPAFAGTRESARKTTCAANLRQIGMAMSMYADDHDGLGPPTSGWHLWGGDESEGDEPWPSWEERIAPYVRSKALYRCPSCSGVVEFSYFLSTRMVYIDRWTKYIDYNHLAYPPCQVVAGNLRRHPWHDRGYGCSRAISLRAWQARGRGSSGLHSAEHSAAGRAMAGGP